MHRTPTKHDSEDPNEAQDETPSQHEQREEAPTRPRLTFARLTQRGENAMAPAASSERRRRLRTRRRRGSHHCRPMAADAPKYRVRRTLTAAAPLLLRRNDLERAAPRGRSQAPQQVAEGGRCACAAGGRGERKGERGKWERKRRTERKGIEREKEGERKGRDERRKEGEGGRKERGREKG